MAVGASLVLGMGCESIFAELFVFAPGVPTAPTREVSGHPCKGV